MKNIIFHFHSTDSVLSKLIEWKTGSHVSHVSIEVNNCIYNAYAEKRFYKSTKLSADVFESFSIPVSNDLADYAHSILDDYVGSLYDYKSIFGFMFNKNRQSNGRVYCSEIANVILELIIGSKVKFEKLVSPEMIRIAIQYYLIGLNKAKPKSTGK